MSAICNALDDHVRLVGTSLIICPLYRTLPEFVQNDAVRQTPQGHRKVVVSTNIAETSVTIDGIVHVIDTGRCKRMYFDPHTGFYVTEDLLISQCSAKQRAGRAGRTRPGKCYRLYPESTFMYYLIAIFCLR